MKVWLFRNDYNTMNEVAVLALPDDNQTSKQLEVFNFDGTPRKWKKKPPKLDVYRERRGKNAEPRVDISTFISGTLALNKKAHAAFTDILSPFGQLLEIEVENEIEYLVNITNMIPCLNRGLSKLRSSGSIEKEVLNASAIPKKLAVFKDPELRFTHIYVNEPAKIALEAAIKKYVLTGSEFVPVEVR